MMMIIGVLTAIAILCLVVKLYGDLSAGICRSQRSMEGKTVIVTGANCGIGLETARDLARRKARVILACRSEERGKEAENNIRESVDGSVVIVHALDLSSFSSIRKFAARILSTEERLDVLVHNAGITVPPGKHMTEDNLELQFATNHFGPFLLTFLLLDILKRSAPSRIVIVSSGLYFLGKLDFNNLNCEKYQRDPFWIYCDSKLANILFARALSRRLQGTGVTVNSLHPGGVRTPIYRNASGFLKYIVVPIIYPLMKSAKLGAQTSIYLAVSEEVEDVTGEYFVDCKRHKTTQRAKNDENAERLWKISKILTGISVKEENGEDLV